MSVSVIAPTCMQADSLASALCVLKPSDGMALVRREKGVESMQILAGDDGELVIYRSEGFPAK
jgi:thiamine biosynthesis lipoprotein ApbE